MKLLLAIDDSKFSKKAVDALCHIDWLEGSELIILNVVKPVDYLLPFGIMDDTSDKEQELVNTRLVWLEKLAGTIADKLPSMKIRHVVKFGDTRFVIVNTAFHEAVDLIVMGSQGRTGVERMLLGSVSCGVVEYAPCPTMIIKGDEKSWHDFSRVLVAFDGSAYSHDAIDWLCDRNWSPGVKIHVVMALPEFDTADARDISMVEGSILKEQWSRIHGKATEMLVNTAATIAECVGRDNVTFEALPGDPRTELLKAATKFGAELFIVGSRGRTGLTKFLLGSVSLHLANHTTVPIVIVRRLAPQTLASLYSDEGQLFADKFQAGV